MRTRASAASHWRWDHAYSKDRSFAGQIRVFASYDDSKSWQVKSWDDPACSGRGDEATAGQGLESLRDAGLVTSAATVLWSRDEDGGGEGN